MPKKQKLTKEEKETLKRAEEERRLLEEELARQKAEEEERQRLERERLEREEQERIRLEEAGIREVQQKKLKVVLDNLKEANIVNKVAIWNNVEWYCLQKRSSEPHPLDALSVDGYICEWKDRKYESRDSILKEIDHCLQLISDIDVGLVYRPIVTEADEEQWEHNRTRMKSTISGKLKCIIYELLVECENYMNADSNNSERTLHYPEETPEDKEPLLSLCVWVNFAENLRFAGMSDVKRGLKFEVPSVLIAGECVVVMMHTAFDHVSRRRLSPKLYLPLEKVEGRSKLLKEYEPDEPTGSECAAKNEQLISTSELPWSSSELPGSTSELPGSTNEFPGSTIELPGSEVGRNGTESNIHEQQVPEGNSKVPEIQEPVADEAEVQVSADIDLSPRGSSLFYTPDSLEIIQNTKSMVEMVGESVASLSVSASVTPTTSSGVELPRSPSQTSLVEPEPELVNLSEYYVIGGMFHTMALLLPKLPVKSGPWIMCYNEGEQYTAELLPYKATIIPIRQPKPGMSPAEAAEFADAEIRRFESEMLDSISITLRLPKNVLFLEQPLPALFLPEKCGFTTSGFFDVRYDDDTGSLSFKVNQFGDIGVMTKKYANFPFQSWELKPGHDLHQSMLTLNGALVLLEIEISDEGCKILSIKHGDSAMFQHICNSFMAPWQLVQKLSSVGINILAEDDGFPYIGVPQKHFGAEDWTYFCMSLLSSFCTFSWSRWNSTASSDQLILKCTREIKPVRRKRKTVKEGSFLWWRLKKIEDAKEYTAAEIEKEEALKNMPTMVMVTPERAVYLKCTDASETFSEEPAEDQTFCSDLYHLMIKDLPVEPICKLQDTDLLFAINIYSLLSLCRLLSCS